MKSTKYGGICDQNFISKCTHTPKDGNALQNDSAVTLSAILSSCYEHHMGQSGVMLTTSRHAHVSFACHLYELLLVKAFLEAKMVLCLFPSSRLCL